MTLIEAMISIGVLAVALPLVYGAMGEAGKSGAVAEAETRSAWIIPVCLREVRASREGRSEYFPETAEGEEFPGSGEEWVLAFAADGSLVGKVGESDFENGVREVEGEDVRYLVTMSAEAEDPEAAGVSAGVEPMLRLEFVIEYPAAAPEEQRRSLEFLTKIP